MTTSKSKINKEIDDATLPSLLYQLRKQLDLSQKSMAVILNVSTSLIAQVEKGETPFSKRLFQKIMERIKPNHLTDLIKLRFELFDGDADTPQIEVVRKIREGMHEVQNRQGRRLYSVICHKTGEGRDTKCKYEIVLTTSLFNEGEFRHNWPNVEPKYILVDICDSYDDAYRKVRHLKHCYSQWNLNFEGLHDLHF